MCKQEYSLYYDLNSLSCVFSRMDPFRLVLVIRLIYLHFVISVLFN